MAQAVVLCCRYSGGKRKRIDGLTLESAVGVLQEKISNLTGIEVERQRILLGFPPAQLDLVNGRQQSLDVCGIRSGDTLTIEESKTAPVQKEETKPLLPDSLPKSPSVSVTGTGSTGKITRFIVASDNSCLFASLSYLMFCGEVSFASDLRKLCADCIENDPLTFTDVLLGKDNANYCRWLRDSSSWGGAIELMAFSKYYNMEIDVVDIQTVRVDRFGEDGNFPNRLFLLYDGIHYDPLYLDEVTNDSASDAKQKTIFSVKDETVLDQVMQLAKDENKKSNFVDLAGFSLRCTICRALLTGQADAQAHAKKTGHTSFGEVKQ